MDEQMLLCTLLPFKNFEYLPDEATFLESSDIHIVWRTNEIRICSPDSRLFSVSIPSCTWHLLLMFKFCKLFVIFYQGQPAGIRVYTTLSIHQNYVEKSLCDTQFLSFETCLAKVLYSTVFTIEKPHPKKKKLYQDLSLRTFEIDPSAPVSEDLIWCFIDMTFKPKNEKHVSKTASVRPSYLVANCTEHWRETLLDTVKKFGQTILIITDEPSAWPNTVPFTEQPLQDIKNYIFTITSEDLKEQYILYIELMENVSKVCTKLYGSSSAHQSKRILLHNLVPKLVNFSIPVHMHLFTTVVLDNAECLRYTNTLPNACSKNWVNVFYDNDNSKPMHLKPSQLSKLTSLSNEYLPLLQSSDFLTCLSVPKQLLRKYRVYGHLVRNGPIEDRIEKLFPMGCPIKPVEAIQRFSGKPMPGTFAAELLTSHFQRLGSSLGEYSSSGQTHFINKEFVNEALNGSKSCCICFDDLCSEFHFAVCGHIYCKECSTNYFKMDWSQNKPKDCAMCRVKLLLGDLFFVEDIVQFKPLLSTKETCIVAFKNSMRSKNLSEWEENNYTTKNTIASNINVLSVKNILSREPHNLHVFYTNEEANLFFQLKNNFC